jgi:hypothetical protein
MVGNLQDDFRKGLLDGTIVLSRSELAALQKGKVIILAGGLIVLGSASAIKLIELEVEREEMLASVHAAAEPFKANIWYVDFFNGAADLEFIAEMMIEVSYYDARYKIIKEAAGGSNSSGIIFTP